MSLTYDETLAPSRTAADAADAFTPVYARAPVRRKGKVRTWMVLAPIGALTVAALGAWALMSPGEDTAAPEAAAPVAINSAPASSDLLASADPMVSAPAADPQGALTPSAEPATTAEVDVAPAASRASAPEPVRAAPVASAEAAAPPAPEVVLSTGPQSYEAVTAAEAPAAPAPSISAPAESPPLIVIED